MATQHSTQEHKKITVICQGNAKHPGTVTEILTPEGIEALDLMDQMDAADQQDMLRVVIAMKKGLFRYTAAEIDAWTPEHPRAVINALPEIVVIDTLPERAA